MRRRLTLARVLLAIAGLVLSGLTLAPSVPIAAQTPTGATVYEGARLITGESTAPIENSAFVVQNGRFTAVGRRGQVNVPAGAARVDLTGKTVMPGIVDAHSHLATTREALVEQLQRGAYYGVVAALSMGTDPGDLPYQIRGETIPNAARYRTAGRGIVSPDGGPGRSKIPYEVTTEAAARAAVRDLAPRRPDVVKIWVDDRLGTVEKLSPAMYEAIIDEAHQAKLRVVSHIFALEDGKGLLRKPGLDGFAHLVRDKDVDDEFMRLIKQRPNIFVLPNLPDRAVDEDVAWLRDTIAPEPLWRLSTAGARRTAEQTKTAQDFHGIQARNLAKLNAAGVKIGFGTDGSSGYTVHTEMADMVTAGMTPAQVLVAATRTAAEIVGIPDLGTVASGKSADFVVLDANPLDDIRNTRRISSVFMRGTAVDRAALRSKWTGEGFDEIVIYSPASVQNALRVLGPDYTKARTTRVSYVFSSGGATLNSVRTGAPADIVMLATDLLEPLMKEGLLQPGSMTVLGTVRTGVAIRAGTPAPDISTVEKFKATLLAAKSISYQNPTTGSTSGAQVAKIIADLGLTEQLAGKTKYVGAAGVARGEADMHLQPVSELLPVPGITIVGTLPAELGASSDIAGAVLAKAASPEKAQAFLRYITRPEASATYTENGVVPRNSGSR